MLNTCIRKSFAASILSLAALLLAGAFSVANAADTVTGMSGNAYYKVHPMFHPFPDDKLATQVISRFGPVGIGIELRKDGQTDSEDYAWSGDTLMNLARREALKMTLKKVGEADYLFIEAGGWHPDYPTDWAPELYVMKRQ